MRYAFEEIISNIDILLKEDSLIIDRKGYSLHTWIDYGIVGWDNPLSSYFIHLDNNQDNIPWMIPNGIPTFKDLCDAINYIFDIPDGKFEFQNVIEAR